MALTVFVPVGLVAFLLNSAVQTQRSSNRIKLHEKGLAGINIKNYRVPLWITEIRGAAEDAFGNLHSSHKHEDVGLSEGEDDSADGAGSDAGNAEILALERKRSNPDPPTLALAPSQFAMIHDLDGLGWRKYPVWIHKVRHSHAAIIIRREKSTFTEGKVVFSHWLKEEFIY
jgi:hypothetical protein